MLFKAALSARYRISQIARVGQLIWTPDTATTLEKLQKSRDGERKALGSRQTLIEASVSEGEMDPLPFSSYYPSLPPIPPAMRPFSFPTTSNASPSSRGMIFYPQPLPLGDNSQRESNLEADDDG